MPVPEAIWLEDDPSHLDHPFFVMEELAGLESRPQHRTLIARDADVVRAYIAAHATAVA